MIRSFPDRGEVPEAISGFPSGVIAEDERMRLTFGALRAMHGSEIPSSRQELLSPFVTASASAPVSLPRSPQTPTHAGGARMGPGHFSGTFLYQDRFPSFHPRPTAVTTNGFGNPVRLERNDAVSFTVPVGRSSILCASEI